MKLKALIADLSSREVHGNLDIEIHGVHSDSRRVKKGDLFVAVRGEKADGHEFIGEAVGAGAAAVICDEIVGTFPAITQIKVPDGRIALAKIASKWYEQPSHKLTVVGVTGTNGKTTTSYLIAAILEAAGMPSGVIGTLAYRIGNRELPAPNTTPGADQLQELFAQMLHANLKAVVLEVSSHSLVQHRVDEVLWDSAVFTNLTRDHLDYHKTMEAYFEAKKILFQQLDPSRKKPSAIFNLDDSHSADLVKALREGVRVVTYGIQSQADVRAESIEPSVSGCSFKMVSGGVLTNITTPLCGLHNVSNCLAAGATGLSLGIDLSTIQKGLQSVKNIPGRLERVSFEGGVVPFAVFVDYAHTDDALKNVLKTLRPLTKRKLIAVFGCGGNRDTTKRPLMGRVASELADFSIVTTDNPRFEEPEEIIKQIIQGFESNTNFLTIVDRRDAIARALSMAETGDVVLLAGKGHETYQEIKGVKSPFDDRKIAAEILEELARKGGEAWKN
jgi:UDP-N-acetylmuramoyl-L-alanyl-D-glutamate--2,6-diaminopimelate ligase